jgi:hypothetical protein
MKFTNNARLIDILKYASRPDVSVKQLMESIEFSNDANLTTYLGFILETKKLAILEKERP